MDRGARTARPASGDGARARVRAVQGAVLRAGLRTARGRASTAAVVTVTADTAPFLADCVDALGGQQRRPDEVVVVPSGEDAVPDAPLGARPGSTLATAVAAVAAAHRRVRVVPAPAPEGVPDALRTAFVWFLEAGDVPAADALARLAGALSRSGSDLATRGRADATGCHPGDPGSPLPGPPVTVLWRRRALARLLPRTGPPRTGGPLDGWLPAALALTGATSYDLCDLEVVAAPARTGVAFGTLPVLAPHVRALRAGLATCLADPPAASWLLPWLVRDELPRWWADAERATDEQWQALAALAADTWDRSPPEVRAQVAAEDRVRWWLAAQDRRADLVAFVADRWQEEVLPPTTRDGPALLLAPEAVPAEVPGPVRALAARETALAVRVLRAARRPRASGGSGTDAGDRHEVSLELAVWVPGVPDAGDPAPTVRLSLRHGGERVVARDVVVRADPEVDRLAAAPHQRHAHGLVHATLAVPASWGARATLEVQWVQDAGPGAEAHPDPRAGAPPPPALVREAAVAVRLGRPAPPGDRPRLLTLTPAGDALVLRLDGAAPADALALWAVDTPAAGVPGPVAVAGPAGDDPRERRLSLRHDPWGLGDGPLPSGRYRLGWHTPDGPVPVGTVTALEARLPLRATSATYRLRAEPGAGAWLAVVLQAPRADDEVGAHAQQRLRRRYAERTAPVDPRAVYLQSYTGGTCTDSPLAIHHELRRTRPDLVLRWGVADRSVRVPEGAEPVLLHTREWYDVLATSGSVVVNADLERWYRRRPGQRVLQTFHGYPSKTMGLSAWEAKNLTPALVARQLARTSATWDLLLTPTPEMDRYYRRDYRYEGPIHPYGYPRDDLLVSARAAGVRAEVRDRLGVGDRTAVLYAPTWRDHLATNFRSAAMTAYFDEDLAADLLGEDHLLLVRGHRFHRPRPRRRREILDVTGYPEVNDLLLAADAVVLDYSSMRFDVALTGTPMVFLVPDLDRVATGNRGFLYDFEGSAPGPLLASTEEVAAALSDLAGLRAAYAPAYAAFRERFWRHQDDASAARVVRAFFGPPDAPLPR